MQAEILSTGDEVLTGAVVDSNAAFIARKFIETGLRVSRHTSVGDDLEEMTAALKEIGGRADIAVVTGGLGPTVDDITAGAAARAAGAEVRQNPTALSYIESFFKKYYRSMTASDYQQAELPVGAEPILNEAGTAPGFKLQVGGCICFFLPGVPAEMRRMLTDSVIPVIENHYIEKSARTHYREKRLSLFGLPEAEVNQRLKGVSEKLGEVKLGMIAQFPVIDIKVAGFGKDPAALEAEIESAAGQIQSILGQWIFSTAGESMAEVLGHLLRASGASVAMAESCTGGLIADKLTNVSGSSDYFRFSAVTYANAAKIDMLGVSPATLNSHGAVSEETVREMAEGVRRISGADYGIATSGIAGPTGGTEDKPVGTVCFGVAAPDRTYTEKKVFPFRDRLANKAVFAQWAMDMLRRVILKI